MLFDKINTVKSTFSALVPWKSKGAYRYTKDQLVEPKHWFRMKSLNPSNWKPFTR